MQARRIRRLKRRFRRTSKAAAPILLLLAAAALSLGVVRVVERGPGLGLDDEPTPDRFAEPVPLQNLEVESRDMELKIDASPDFDSPDPAELIRAAIPASVLDVDWSMPEPKMEELPAVEAPGPWLRELAPEPAPPQALEGDEALSVVPEPRSSLLLAGGLGWLGTRRSDRVGVRRKRATGRSRAARLRR